MISIRLQVKFNFYYCRYVIEIECVSIWLQVKFNFYYCRYEGLMIAAVWATGQV